MATSKISWNDDNVKAFLKNNPDYMNFITGTTCRITYDLAKTRFLIIREEVGVKFYYPSPYRKENNYLAVEDFIKSAKPILDKVVEDNRKKNLMDPSGNISVKEI